VTKKTEAFDQIMEHGVDLKNRILYFGRVDAGDDGAMFTWDSVEKAIRGLHILASQNKQPIELHMNSCGGSSSDMLRLHDEIMTCPCKIIFVGSGECTSSATWIMACCDYRKLYENTHVLLHDGSDTASDRHTDFLINSKHSEEHMDLLYQLYADNSVMPFDFWADICQRDVPLTPYECLTLGLIDEVIKPAARGNLRKARTRRLNNMDEVEIKALTKTIYKRIRKKRNLNKIEISVKQPEYDPNLVENEPEDLEPSDSTLSTNSTTVTISNASSLPEKVGQQSDETEDPNS